MVGPVWDSSSRGDWFRRTGARSAWTARRAAGRGSGSPFRWHHRRQRWHPPDRSDGGGVINAAPPMPPLKVLFVASEVAPFRKTGGLADVAGALPKALRRRGIDVRVVMPLYGGIKWHD